MPISKGVSVFIGNLDEKVEERTLHEIMIQAGPLAQVYIPRDEKTKRHRGYGFAEYTSEESAEYAVKLFSGTVRLCGKILRFNIAGTSTPLETQDGRGASVRPPAAPKPLQQSQKESTYQTPGNPHLAPKRPVFCHGLKPYPTSLGSHDACRSSIGSNGRNGGRSNSSHWNSRKKAKRGCHGDSI